MRANVSQDCREGTLGKELWARRNMYYGIAKYLDLTIQFIQSPLNMTPSMVKHDNLALQVQSR